jgi:hypothetical protein
LLKSDGFPKVRESFDGGAALVVEAMHLSCWGGAKPKCARVGVERVVAGS